MYVAPSEEDVKKIREEGMYVIFVKMVVYKMSKELEDAIRRIYYFGIAPESLKDFHKNKKNKGKTPLP